MKNQAVNEIAARVSERYGSYWLVQRLYVAAVKLDLACELYKLLEGVIEELGVGSSKSTPEPDKAS